MTCVIEAVYENCPLIPPMALRASVCLKPQVRPRFVAVPESHFGTLGVSSMSSGGQDLAVWRKSQSENLSPVVLEPHQLLAPGDIPENHFSRFRPTGQRPAIRGEGNGMHHRSVFPQTVSFAPAGKLPDPNGIILPPGGSQQPAVWAKGNAQDYFAMSAQDCEGLPLDDVQQEDTGGRCDSNRPAVRREGQTFADARQPRQFPGLARPNLP